MVNHNTRYGLDILHSHFIDSSIVNTESPFSAGLRREDDWGRLGRHRGMDHILFQHIIDLFLDLHSFFGSMMNSVRIDGFLTRLDFNFVSGDVSIADGLVGVIEGIGEFDDKIS